jgi:hypothetical protein
MPVMRFMRDSFLSTFRRRSEMKCTQDPNAAIRDVARIIRDRRDTQAVAHVCQQRKLLERIRGARTHGGAELEALHVLIEGSVLLDSRLRAQVEIEGRSGEHVESELAVAGRKIGDEQHRNVDVIELVERRVNVSIVGEKVAFGTLLHIDHFTAHTEALVDRALDEADRPGTHCAW